MPKTKASDLEPLIPKPFSTKEKDGITSDGSTKKPVDPLHHLLLTALQAIDKQGTIQADTPKEQQAQLGEVAGKTTSIKDTGLFRFFFKSEAKQHQLSKLDAYNDAFLTVQKAYRDLPTRIVRQSDDSVEPAPELVAAKQAFKEDILDIFKKTRKARYEVSKELSKPTVIKLKNSNPQAYEERLSNATDYIDRRVDEAILNAMATNSPENSKQFGASVGQAKINETVKGDVIYRNGDRAYIKPDFSSFGSNFEKTHKNHQPYICTDRGDLVDGKDPLSEKRVEGVVANQTMPVEKKVLKQTTKKKLGDDPFARTPKIATAIGGENTQKKSRGGV